MKVIPNDREILKAKKPNRLNEFYRTKFKHIAALGYGGVICGIIACCMAAFLGTVYALVQCIEHKLWQIPAGIGGVFLIYLFYIIGRGYMKDESNWFDSERRYRRSNRRNRETEDDR